MPDSETPTLLLLDGHSLAYRAFYALREVDMSTTTGQPTNAVFGFTSMLINLMRDETPTHIGVAFDVSRATFRRDAYPEYKAGRSETPDDFRGQVELIRKVLDALHIRALAVDNYEADDVIATLTKQAEAAGMTVLICTGDRDALQLVDDNVTVLYPRRGVSEMTRFTPAAVAEKYGLSPRQYPDFAALRGDPSDNLPNIPGVGEKTAAKWVRDYGSLATLAEQVDTVKGKAGDALRENLAGVLRNRQLTELVTDVEVEARVEDLAREGWDREQVHALFDELQFRVLRERLFKEVAAAEEEADEGFDVSFVRLDVDEVEQWLGEHARDVGRVGVAFRGQWGRGTGALTGIALASPDGASAYLDPERLSPDDDAAFAAWLADPSVPKATHDIKGPVLALREHGWDIAGVTSDTQLAAYL
ncbi:MAG TPA: 5'-3' exonuclease H3TH domain-containing protein, partial [Jatrophihabitantaceae bacterium]